MYLGQYCMVFAQTSISYLNIDPKPHARYRNPSSSGSQDTEAFSIVIMTESKKGHNPVCVLWSKVNQAI